MNPHCPKCPNLVESVEHVLCECPLAAAVWRSLGINWPPQGSQWSFKEWLSWVFNNYTSKRHGEILTTLWAIWYARNKQYHEENITTRRELTAFILAHCKEYSSVNARIQTHPPPKQTRWLPPNAPWVKVNFDASFSHTNKEAWSGIIIRDSVGEILGAAKRKIRRATSVFAAEATAAVHAIQFRIDLGCMRAIFEGDSKTIIQKLQSDEEDLSEVGAMIWDGKFLASKLHAATFHFTQRAGNVAAHILAKERIEDNEDRFWIEDPPPNE
ncbi:uncharacterized protein LOC120209283 [Hibiscus syriacus]|uniref:uncharacterized protein LOC120209283 n=1 Tax=Hibiscus syriacus TaxID=106335 RepID=UPI0019227C08|nr:uncharacterized protein LOC120209283 [Hibiscus syriacus]